MARIPRRFSAAVSQVQDKLGGFSERFTASKKPQSAAESGAGDSAPQSSRTSEGGANPWQFTKSWFAKFFRPDNPSITLRVSLSGAWWCFSFHSPRRHHVCRLLRAGAGGSG